MTLATNEIIGIDPVEGFTLPPSATGGWIAGTTAAPSAPFTFPATLPAGIKLQYLDPGAAQWKDFGPAHDVGSVLRTRRFALGPGETVTAQQFRLVLVGGFDYGANRLRWDGLKFWKEFEPAINPDAEAVKLFAFNFDTAEQRYILAMTAGNVEIYRQGERVASVPTPYYLTSAVTTHTRAQALDTLITFHPDFAPQRIMRQGAHTEWDSRDLTFSALPLYDYDGQNAGGVNEVQQLTFRDYLATDTFNLSLEAETTESIVYSGGGAAIQAALEALPSVGAGQVAVTDQSGGVFRVEFKGRDLASNIGEIAGRTLVSDKGGVSTATLTQGKPGGEPVISAPRGWPACGCFYQARLFMGGLKSRPQTILGSRLGDYFNFDTTGADAAGALDETLDTDEVTTIVSLFPGQHLQVFTSSAEFFFPSEPIKPPAAVKQTTRRGVQPGTTQWEMDGGTLFVTAGGHALAQYVYADGVQPTYTAEHLSVLSSHLIGGRNKADRAARRIVDMGFRRARSTSESDLAFMARVDGAATVMIALRDQDVTGFAPWITDGKFLSSASEIGGDLYVAVERWTAGGDRFRTLERVDDDRLLDSSMTGAPAAASVACPHLEGRTVIAYIDGADAGDVVVAGGAAALPYRPLRSVEVGLNFQPRGRTLPGVLQDDKRGGASQALRTGEVAFRLGATANLKAGMVGGRMWRVPLKSRPNALLDQGPGEDAFTGWTRLWGVPGFRADAQIEWVQERPGPLQIEEIVVSVQG